MRRARFTAAVALALAAAPALSQDGGVRVRGGEHPTYSRVVIDAPRGTAFAWGVDGDRLTVSLPDLAQPLDARAVAAGRGLSRVAGVAAAPNLLTVVLGCACGARVGQLEDGRIVIDVAEGAPRPAPAFAAAAGAGDAADPEAAPAAPASAAPASAAPAPVAPPVRPAPASRTASAAPASAEQPAPPPAAGAGAPSGSAAEPAAAQADPVAALRAALAEAAQAEASSDPAQAAPEPTPDAAPEPTAEAAQAATVEAARRRLLEQLTRAAEEGLLNLADRDNPPEPPAPMADAEAAKAADPQVRARNALEIARDRDAAVAAAPPPPPDNCLTPEHFAIADWATDAPFDAQIGPKRRALVGEFDAPSSDAVFAYARLLTHFGFGREARAALAAFAGQITPAPALSDMAMVVDREAPPADGALRKGLGCAGPHGLWAAAAAGLAGELDPAIIDADALRQPLSAAPERLRAALATPVATAALDGGRIEVAETLAGIAARAEPPLPDGDAMLAVLLARLDAARGFHERAEAALTEIARQNSPAGVEAMIRLAEARALRGMAPPAGLAENMEAVAFSLGQSREGRRLLAAAARARATGEGLAPALTALAALARRAGDQAAAMQAARDMLVDYDPAPEEAAAYAEAVLAHWDLVGDEAEGDRARVAVAQRLAGMGLENLAERLMAPALLRGDGAARMAAAEAATAAGSPERALAHLDGMTGPAAARARAGALSALDRNQEAAEAAQEAGDPALAARYAWLAGNWEAASAAGALDRRILAAWMAGAAEMPAELRAAAEDDPDLAALAQAFAAAPPRDGADLLGEAAAALTEAQKRRKLMGGLLSDG